MNALNFAPDMSATAAREAIRLSGFSARKELDGLAIYAPRGRLTAEGFKADAPAEFRPQPCQQPQARHTPPADALGRRPSGRVWGVAVVPAELAAAFALAPVPRVEAAAVWQAIRDAREADAAARS